VVGIIIATNQEASPLLARAGITAGHIQAAPSIYDLRAAWQMVVCVCGMGPANAQVGVDMLLAERDLTAVVNAGIAGAVGESVGVGEIFRISKVCLWPYTQTMYTCREDRWTDLPSAMLATVDRPVFDQVWRCEIACHADIVDMEGAVIAQACRARNMPLYAIKGITDLAGDGDRELMLGNLGKMSGILADRVWREFVR